ncbi:MAG TPA: AAA family ATPase, partial [Bacteroidia bacterium]|nr:AAA family ATPase [Bacteroidia bacterium]
VRSVNQCINDAKSRPIPKMLFSEFWHEEELCILFADTNLGKSILAVQIANSISKGEAIRGFRLEAQKQVVMYFDFEMSDKQFEKRYSINYANHFIFDNNFLRIEINPDCTDFNDFEKALFEAIENNIVLYDAKILIIDNLTYLKTQATETAKEALPLMKRLKELKIKHNLSILALAHTPKRNLIYPITKNDLAGSKHLSNFADSIFAIGESCKDKSLRYLKQLKARATEVIYDSENIIVSEISQPYNFLAFEFVDFSNEREHLKQPTENEQADLDASILSLKASEPHLADREIARQLNTNPVKVGRVLKRSKV